MNIINQAVDNYRNQIAAKKQIDPLAQLAAHIGLKVNTPEAEQKLRIMGEAISQQAAQTSQVQQTDAVDKATTDWKQSQFVGKV